MEDLFEELGIDPTCAELCEEEGIESIDDLIGLPKDDITAIFFDRSDRIKIRGWILRQKKKAKRAGDDGDPTAKVARKKTTFVSKQRKETRKLSESRSESEITKPRKKKEEPVSSEEENKSDDAEKSISKVSRSKEKRPRRVEKEPESDQSSDSEDIQPTKPQIKKKPIVKPKEKILFIDGDERSDHEILAEIVQLIDKPGSKFRFEPRKIKGIRYTKSFTGMSLIRFITRGGFPKPKAEKLAELMFDSGLMFPIEEGTLFKGKHEVYQLKIHESVENQRSLGSISVSRRTSKLSPPNEISRSKSPSLSKSKEKLGSFNRLGVSFSASFRSKKRGNIPESLKDKENEKLHLEKKEKKPKTVFASGGGDDSDNELKELVAALLSAKPRFRLQSRKYKTIRHRKCFAGSDLIKWLVKNKKHSKAKALEIGQNLFSKKLLFHVGDEIKFLDGTDLYEFATHRFEEPKKDKPVKRPALNAEEDLFDTIVKDAKIKSSGNIKNVRKRKKKRKVEKKDGKKAKGKSVKEISKEKVSPIASKQESQTLEQLLKSIDLVHCLPSFEEENIDVQALPILTNDDMKGLGMKMGDRRKLITWQKTAKAEDLAPFEETPRGDEELKTDEIESPEGDTAMNIDEEGGSAVLKKETVSKAKDDLNERQEGEEHSAEDSSEEESSSEYSYDSYYDSYSTSGSFSSGSSSDYSSESSNSESEEHEAASDKPSPEKHVVAEKVRCANCFKSTDKSTMIEFKGSLYDPVCYDEKIENYSTEDSVDSSAADNEEENDDPWKSKPDKSLTAEDAKKAAIISRLKKMGAVTNPLQKMANLSIKKSKGSSSSEESSSDGGGVNDQCYRCAELFPHGELSKSAGKLYCKSCQDDVARKLKMRRRRNN